MTKHTIKIDASALKNSTCMLRFYNTVYRGLRRDVKFNDILYGSAFHKFISEMYMTKGNFAEAMKAATDIFRQPSIIRKANLTEKHLVKTCLDYWEHFRGTDNFDVLEVNGKPLVEVTFEITILETEHTVYKLVGTIDKVGKFVQGCYGIGDYKTTSSWNADDYFDKYKISTQLLTYYYALHKLAEMNPDSKLAEICKTAVGCFIDGVFLSAKEAKFQRSRIFFFERDLLEEYEHLLIKKTLRLDEWVESNICRVREGIIQGSCVEQAFPCEYYPICSASDKIAGEHIEKRDYVIKEYDPFKFGKAD